MKETTVMSGVSIGSTVPPARILKIGLQLDKPFSQILKSNKDGVLVKYKNKKGVEEIVRIRTNGNFVRISESMQLIRFETDVDKVKKKIKKEIDIGNI